MKHGIIWYRLLNYYTLLISQKLKSGVTCDKVIKNKKSVRGFR